MAVKVLTVADVKAFDAGVLVTTEASTVASDGFIATVDGDIFILAQNVSVGTPYDLTIKYGNADQGVADTVVTVAQATQKLIKINTGKFKNLSGTNVGKILMVPGHVDLQVKVIEV